MPESRPKVILQAHATRATTALALLLHGRDRGPRDLKRPLGALITSLVLAIAILLVIVVAGRIGAAVHTS